MSLIKANLRRLCESVLEDSDITNADRQTFEHHVACLSDRLEQLCDEYQQEAAQDAASGPSDEQKYLGSPAYYRDNPGV